MIGLLFDVGVLLASQTLASAPKVDYPSCSLTVQRAIEGQTGGTIRDVRQAPISVRTHILQADMGTARKARRLSQVKADALWRQWIGKAWRRCAGQPTGVSECSGTGEL